MELFIPLHPKDRAILPHTIAAARKYIVPEITRVTVVAAEDTQVDGACFMHQDDVIPGLKFADMPRIFYGPINRTGWYFQQLLKLGLHRHAKDHYLCLDADTVFVKERRVIADDGRYIFARTQQHHAPYFETFQKLLGVLAFPQVSFIADHMVFDVEYVAELLRWISLEGRQWAGGDVAWYRAILRHVHGQDISTFSEFETYGNFMCFGHVNRFTSEGYHTLTLPPQLINDHERQVKEAQQRGFAAISYHARPGFNIPLEAPCLTKKS